MANKNQGPNNTQTTNGNTNQPQNAENQKRMNQVPNSKNPKVPGNEAPYR